MSRNSRKALNRKKRQQKKRKRQKLSDQGTTSQTGEITSMQGSPVRNKKTTSKDKLNAYRRRILTLPPSLTSGAESTFVEEAYRSYYNSQVKGWSDRLSFPTETECVDLLSTSSNTFSDSMERHFWFTNKRIPVRSPNLPPISWRSTPCSLVDSKEDAQRQTENEPEAIPVMTNKVRLYFNFYQKVLLKRWMGSCRFIYNMVTRDYTRTSRLKKLPFYRRLLEQEFADRPYLRDVPYNSRDGAISDAISNIKTVLSLRVAQPGRHHSVPTKTKKANHQVLSVRAQNISPTLKVYPGILFAKNLAQKVIPTLTPAEKNLRLTESKRAVQKHVQRFRKQKSNYDPSRIVRDSRIQWDRKTNEWYLCLVVQRKPEEILRENQAEEKRPLKVVSIDPGNRTFATWYSPEEGIGKVGDDDSRKLVKLCLYLDKLMSLQAKSNRKKKRKLDKCAHRVRRRISNLRDDLHRKFASWLVSTFDIIVLPEFNTHLMSQKGRRKINAKTVRGLMTWAHGKFRERLRIMCKQAGKILLHPSEAYTSKTCSGCGWINETLGGNEIFKCQNHGHNIDRDVNGARGILLRAMLGGALLIE